ncbi:MAG TPA: ankyrin repeat domain-containing protein [Verrucomicrobiae bacterium]|nr:ankyrin repeat domain-containing protein [Verrucomicrobiae bacterium]
MKKQLPARPTLEQLKKQAKDLHKLHASGDAEAIQRARESHPQFVDEPDEAIRDAEFPLSDAQLVIAREYGFESWPKLKAHVQSVALETDDPAELFKEAVTMDNTAHARRILERHPELKDRINEPLLGFDAPAIVQARSREMIDVLLAAGADINAKSRWWAGGFGLLHGVNPELAAYAVERGAIVDIHAAARMGLLDRLRALVSADPALVHARGGDGQTPLHFASTAAIAEYLLDHGADIEARDVDHESTPAQYMVKDRQDVARCLIRHGCKTDILMAAALGDADLVSKHLDNNPDCTRLRVSDEFFPMVGGKTGGTIYQWTLGWYVSAHQVARQFGHEDVLSLLMERSPVDVKLLAACWLGDESTVKSLLAMQPNIAASLLDADRRHLAHAARNDNLTAVRLMLTAGLPLDGRSQEGGTPLHWAAFYGDRAMVMVLLQHNPPLEITDTVHNGTPLDWAIYGSQHSGFRQVGNYPVVVEMLIKAGAKFESPDGTEEVKEVMRRYGDPNR